MNNPNSFNNNDEPNQSVNPFDSLSEILFVGTPQLSDLPVKLSQFDKIRGKINDKNLPKRRVFY